MKKGELVNERESTLALRAYEAYRMKRSAAIIRQSYLFDRIAQWENPVLRSLRDALTPLAFATVLLGAVRRARSRLICG